MSRKGIINLLFLSALMVLAGCGTDKPDETTGATPPGAWTEQPALAVDGLEVVAGRLMPAVEAGSVVEGIQEAVVVSQTQGMIKSVFVEIGDRLKAGTPLLKVDDSIARLNLEQAEEQLENARITLEAQERLKDSGGVSQADLLRVRSSYRGAQSFYQTALKTYENTTLTSPLDGLLAWKASNLEVGNYLSPGQLLYRVADLSGIRVTLAVGERQVGLIHPDAEAWITIPSALGTNRLPGRVKAVAAGSDLATGSYTVIVEAENPPSSGIRAGMTAAVSIESDDPREGIIIPQSAVVRRDGADSVFVQDGTEAGVRTIKTGESLGNRLLVEEGLKQGDILIISGLSSLKPGDPVTVRLAGNSEEGI